MFLICVLGASSFLCMCSPVYILVSYMTISMLSCLTDQAQICGSHNLWCAGAPFIEVPHDSESSAGGSANSATSLPEDAALNPIKRSVAGQYLPVDIVMSVHEIAQL